MKALNFISTAALTVLLTACGDDPNETDDTTPTDPSTPVSSIYIYHSEQESNVSFAHWGDTWGSGSTIEPVSDSDYGEVLRINYGSDWGTNNAVVAWGNEDADAIDASGLDVARFKVKGDSIDEITVSIASVGSSSNYEQTYSISDGTSLGNGWTEMEVSFPGYSNLTWVGLMFPEATSVDLVDVYIADSDGNGDDGGDPGTETDAFVIYSDTEATDVTFSDSTIQTWDTGTVLQGDVDFNGKKAWQITSGGIGSWGAVLVYANGLEGDFSHFNYLDLAIATEGSFSGGYKLVVSGDGVAKEYALPVNDSDVTTWQDVRVDIDDLGLSLSSIDHVAVMGMTDTTDQSSFYVTDFQFTKEFDKSYDSNTENEYVFVHSDSAMPSDLVVDGDDSSSAGNVIFGEWSTGTILDMDATYLDTSAWQMVGNGGWGSVIALQGDISDGSTIDNLDVDLSEYTNITLKVASQGNYSKYAVSFVAKNGENESSQEVAFSLAEPSEWNTIDINLAAVGVDLANINQIAVFGSHTDAAETGQTLYVTDFYAYDSGYESETDFNDYGDAFTMISATETIDESDMTFDDSAHLNVGNASFNEWSTNTGIVIDTTYSSKNSWEMTKSDGWGAVLAISGDMYGEIQQFDFDTTVYHTLNLSVATVGAFEKVTLFVGTAQGASKEITLEGVSTDWATFSYDISQLGLNTSTINQLAIFASGGNSGDTLYVTDLNFSK
ncbi:hypothetical protein [Vibrio hippocampi]|uniref:CBM-cenC domain-containing protein n=1 Tax=Vibrio hippocampi TaxID=654686 RepID=A0ABN8DKK1_9VIBR|nr:hypothetical protein [Vibrio hippocampi]CAH0529849.1 hypothetical protein VHP8226_03605 [Vibrio hippocampi]